MLSRATVAIAVTASLAAVVRASERDPHIAKDGAAGAFLLEVTNDTYADAIISHPNLLLQFQASWCGRCKTIRKEYERAAQIAAALELPVTLARFDAGKYTEFAKEHGVKNLPEFYLFRNGEPTEFPMLTTGEAYVAGVAKMLQLDVDVSPVRPLSDDSLEVAQWIFWRGADDGRVMTTIVLFVPEGLTGDAAAHADALEALHTSVAKEMLRFSNLRFAVSRRASLAEFFELPTDRASLVLYKDHDEGRADYDGELSPSALSDWILRHDTPLVTLVWHRTLQAFRKRVPRLALFFLTQAQIENGPLFNAVQSSLQEVAYELLRRGAARRGEFTIGIADGEKYASWATAMGLHAGQLPAVAMEDTNRTLVWTGPDFVRDALCTRGAEARLTDAADARIYKLPAACPEEWAQRVRAAAPAPDAAAAVAVDADGNAKPAFEHASTFAPLAWMDVPVATVTRFLEDALTGATQPAPLRVKQATQSGAADGAASLATNATAM